MKKRRITPGTSKVASNLCFTLHLPTELSDKIFARVQAKDIARCKLVCTSWYKRLSDPNFVEYYTKHTPFTTLVVSRWQRAPNLGRRVFSFVEISSENGTSDCTRTTIEPKLPGIRPNKKKPIPYLSLEASCNGSLCFFVYDHKGVVTYVYNPISKESIVLPECRFDKNKEAVAHQLGFSPSTNTFKVLRIVAAGRDMDRYNRCDRVTRCEIFTVGVDKRWRTLAYPDNFNFPSSMVSLDKVVCWLSKDRVSRTCVIAAFDFEEEKFDHISHPHGLVLHNRDMDLAVLDRSRLCLFDYSTDKRNLWTMEEYGVAESWTKIVVFQSFFPKLFGLRRSVAILRNGNLLFPLESGNSVVYCPKQEEGTVVENAFDMKDLLLT